MSETTEWVCVRRDDLDLLNRTHSVQSTRAGDPYVTLRYYDGDDAIRAGEAMSRIRDVVRLDHPPTHVAVPVAALEDLRDLYSGDITEVQGVQGRAGCNIQGGWGDCPTIEALVAALPEPPRDPLTEAVADALAEFQGSALDDRYRQMAERALAVARDYG